MWTNSLGLNGFDKIKKLREQNPGYKYNFDLIKKAGDDGLENGVHFIEYELDDHGFGLSHPIIKAKGKPWGHFKLQFIQHLMRIGM